MKTNNLNVREILHLKISIQNDHNVSTGYFRVK